MASPLRWKLYDRAGALVAATRDAEEVAMLLSARGAVGDRVKRDGLVCLRVRDDADVHQIGLSIDSTAADLHEEYRMAYSARAVRRMAKVARRFDAQQRIVVQVVSDAERIFPAPSVDALLSRISR